MKLRFLILTSAFLLCAPGAHAQAPRPPVDKLSLQTDVTITSPADKQPLRYDTATSKWINSFSLGPVLIYDGSNLNAANFANRTLVNSAGAVEADWSQSAGFKIPVPLIDGSNIKAIDVS